LIHCDDTQTEEKKQHERGRQRNGETPTESHVADKFKRGMDMPEMMVRTSRSGSMTQEIFYDYCRHFVASLPEDHEPVTLFLDGHASRWNKQALKYLYDNNVFVFFFASHTSIWAQPNDCGLNKRVHWAIEEACKHFRRSGRVPNCEYFNEVLCKGWRIFLKKEADDLLECFDNNATRAFARTGVHPMNPYAEAWTDAIEGLGIGNEECDTASYEIVPSKDYEDEIPALSPLEKSLLRTDLDLNDKNDLGDYYAAEIQASRILGKWWTNIENGVSEGNDRAEYSKVASPDSFATTDCEKLVMKLVAFELVDVDKIPLPDKKSKEKRAKEISETIVDLTPVARPIHISYMVECSSSSSDDDDDTNSEQSMNTGPFDWIDGTAIKRKNGTWRVTISNGDELELTSDEMLASPQIQVKNAYREMNSAQRTRTISKKKRIRATEKKAKERELIQLAKDKRKEEERKEFEKLKEGFESRNIEFSDYEEHLAKMREPFKCDIEGVSIIVSDDSAAVMFDKAALGAMNKVLVIGGGNQDKNGPPKKKRRRNTAAAETGLGLGCSRAHYETDRRDRTQNANAIKTKQKQDLGEKDSLLKLLTSLEKRQKKYVEALKQWRERDNTQSVGCPRAVPYWVCRETDKNSFRVFLQMFLPKYGYGYLGKNSAVQWAAIQGKIRSKVDLTKISFDAKEEELQRRLRVVEQSIQDSQAVQGDEEPTAMNT
jgi:hypothetical protein